MKVIDFKNFPSKLPVTSTIAVYLLLDKFNVPGWTWGIVGTIYAIVWVASIYGIIKQESVDIFKNK